VLRTGDSVSSIAATLPAFIVKMQREVKADDVLADRKQRVRIKSDPVLYPTCIRFHGHYGVGHSGDGALASGWGLDEASGVTVWLDLPTTTSEMKSALSRLRTELQQDRGPNTTVVAMHLEARSWKNFAPLFPGFGHGATLLCHQYGVPVVADETLIGLGIMGSGYYFEFQHPLYGFDPDFMLAGKILGVSVLCSISKVSGMFNYLYDGEGWAQSFFDVSVTLGGSRHTLTNATNLLKYLMRYDILAVSKHMTDTMPVVFASMGLSSEIVQGGGYLWAVDKVKLKQLNHMAAHNIRKALKELNRFRFPIGGTPEAASNQLTSLGLSPIAVSSGGRKRLRSAK
jgi:hypothetical protein